MTLFQITDANAKFYWDCLILDLNQLVQQDRLLRANTGLNQAAFEELSRSFTTAYRG